jgi:hypothetical protein
VSAYIHIDNFRPAAGLRAEHCYRNAPDAPFAVHRIINHFLATPLRIYQAREMRDDIPVMPGDILVPVAGQSSRLLDHLCHMLDYFQVRYEVREDTANILAARLRKPKIAVYHGLSNANTGNWYLKSLDLHGFSYDAFDDLKTFAPHLQKYTTLVMPSADSLAWLEQFYGRARWHQAIRNFVKAGGTYIGSAEGAFEALYIVPVMSYFRRLSTRDKWKMIKKGLFGMLLTGSYNGGACLVRARPGNGLPFFGEVKVRFENLDDPIRYGVPEEITMAYFGGTVMEATMGAEVIAVYRGPFRNAGRRTEEWKHHDGERYQGMPMILRDRVGRGQAILFVAHPEFPGYPSIKPLWGLSWSNTRLLANAVFSLNADEAGKLELRKDPGGWKKRESVIPLQANPPKTFLPSGLRVARAVETIEKICVSLFRRSGSLKNEFFASDGIHALSVAGAVQYLQWLFQRVETLAKEMFLIDSGYRLSIERWLARVQQLAVPVLEKLDSVLQELRKYEKDSESEGEATSAVPSGNVRFYQICQELKPWIRDLIRIEREGKKLLYDMIQTSRVERSGVASESGS